MPNVVNGPAIRRAYEDMGLSREKFAELVELEPKTITNATAPKGGVLSRPAAARIAKVIGWEIGDVVVEDSPGAGEAAEAEAGAAEAAAPAGETQTEASRGAA